MFDQSDPSILWVEPTAAFNGDGTGDRPFQTIDRALSAVRPGNTIVLKPGVYSHTVTVEVSGTTHQPVRIVAENGAEVRAANWFFYDVNNVIVSGLAFRDVPNGAISVIGACRHNRFEELTFIDCGAGEMSSCTMFFGGSGGACNVVENCRFERSGDAPSRGGPFIALMVAEGDADSGAAIMNHLFRKNYFVNYTSGIVLGTGDAPRGQYGHIVEYNTFERCSGDTLLIKCGDTQVRGNLVRECAGTAIAVRAGANSVVERNRVVNGVHGISMAGPGHTVANNCLVRCRGQGMYAAGGGNNGAAQNLFIENNTFVECGSGSGVDAVRHPAIRCDQETSGIIRKNLFVGKGRAISSAAGDMPFVISDNGAGEGIETIEGVAPAAAGFRDRAADDYSNDSGYGASGWSLMPEGFDPHGDDGDPEGGYGVASNDEECGDVSADEDPAEFGSFMERFYNRDAREDDGREEQQGFQDFA
ncbi:MAG: right-handed parallel beta-helix repeat-containing protein [Chitinispirillaceae bacterium]|nr:right-handed parallel beta-helix repeat-containing protein [Chitinispirillaceae bacterium]